MESVSILDVLPEEDSGVFVGRVWDPLRRRPVPVVYRRGKIWDASGVCESVSELLDTRNLQEDLSELLAGTSFLNVEEIALPTERREAAPCLLPPIDLQVIKACGVTFADSMAERVVEERSGGDPQLALDIRETMRSQIGSDLSSVVPGSVEAAELKELLVDRGWWSQYLEVGLGPDPEVFTKGPVLSSVGSGDTVGIPSYSRWNNPEPELVLVVNSRGSIVGVTLGNDVNLRDVEGRSALLLGMAKDFNRSSAVGPFIRILDGEFSIDEARRLEITLHIRGADGFELEGLNAVSALSRNFEELVEASFGRHHQYPDGFVLYTGTLFAPTEDRGEPGEGFTHKNGDLVSISNSKLGSLINDVGSSENLPPWTFGIREYIRAAGPGTSAS